MRVDRIWIDPSPANCWRGLKPMILEACWYVKPVIYAMSDNMYYVKFEKMNIGI